MLAILNSVNAHYLPIFFTDFDDTCIRIHGLQSPFILITRVAVPFKRCF